MSPEFTTTELGILKLISFDLRRSPRDGIFRLGDLYRVALGIGAPTTEFGMAWASLIEQGFLAEISPGEAAITNTGAKFIRMIFNEQQIET